MKTFRLYSLRILTGKENGFQQNEVPIEDGLIINMDDSGKKWLVDAVIQKQYKQLFDNIVANEEKLIIEVVITSPTNYPATMVATMRKITELSLHVSVLIEGHMIIQKDDIIDVILQGIVKEGISGEELLLEFKKRKAERTDSMKKVIENIFNEVEKNSI